MKKTNPQITGYPQQVKGAKPSLAWTLKDYLNTNEEPPTCVVKGVTEGEAMDRDQAIEWIKEDIKCLRVLGEEYPQKFKEQQAIFKADLDYLSSLGKITEDEKDEMLKSENFIFEEPK